MNNDIDNALTDLRLSAARYARTQRYYDGDHDLAFATEKFENTFGTLFREFALNLCPVVCDAVRDKLKVVGFSADNLPRDRVTEVRGARGTNSANSINSATRSIWHANRMAVRSGEVHKDALKNGDAYVIVWPDAAGAPRIFPQRASAISVAYDEDSPGVITYAAKCWRDADKFVRLNLFYPDRIEKYISRDKSEGSLPDAGDFIPVGGVSPTGSASAGSPDSGDTSHFGVVPNPYEVVPVFHFANNAGIGERGRSELDAAIPIQDGLNKAVLDMLVAMEFTAFRQRWATGIEIDYDDEGKAKLPFKAAVDQLWIADSADAKFGDFAAGELEQFLKVKDGFRIDIASVTGTPLHYLLQTAGDLPSGESLKRSETRFVAKVRDRQASFGQVWADVMEFALRIEGRQAVSLITEWEDPSPISERDMLENILLKKQIGLPQEQALIEAGYGKADAEEMK
jgi:hypothetical protein